MIYTGRTSVEGLLQLRRHCVAPVIVDVRSADVQEPARIPAAVAFPRDQFAGAFAETRFKLLHRAMGPLSRYYLGS